jgi:hypothetical protein
MPSIFNKDNRGTVLNKKKPTPQEIAAGLARYNPDSVAPTWEEGLASGYYSSNVGLNYNPLKQEKAVGIIKNPSGLINAIGTLSGLPL